jgi:DNA-binding response OmpR family regulator
MSRILVVDDDPVVRAHFAAAFRVRGHEVAEAASGRVAAADLDAGLTAVDLILVDLIMADGDGFDVIRSWVGRRDRPALVALSGKGNPPSDYLYCALALGADLALSKAEPLVEIVVAVETLLRGDLAAILDLKRRKKPRRTPLLWPRRLVRAAS